LKIQNGGSRHLENNKNRDISAAVRPIFTKFGTLMQNWSLNPFDRKKFRISQIQDGGRPPLKKTVKSPYLCNRLTDFDEIWQDDAYWPSTAETSLKF